MTNDEKLLRALAGASFGPDAELVLPSGKVLDGNEAQALAAFYAPSAEELTPVPRETLQDVQRVAREIPFGDLDAVALHAAIKRRWWTRLLDLFKR